MKTLKIELELDASCGLFYSLFETIDALQIELSDQDIKTILECEEIAKNSESIKKVICNLDIKCKPFFDGAEVEISDIEWMDTTYFCDVYLSGHGTLAINYTDRYDDTLTTDVSVDLGVLKQ